MSARLKGVPKQPYNPENRAKYLKMSLEEKRALYRCRDKYNTLEKVPTWEEYAKENSDRLAKLKSNPDRVELTSDTFPRLKEEDRKTLSQKVSIWRGDITTLEVDAIVNAANNTLLGGGGVDGAIHNSAGPLLVEECSTLNGCETGDAKITAGYNLPAKYVIHTVGPVGKSPIKLQACYERCLQLLKENQLHTIAFPCISTGVYGYPNLPAAKVAIPTVCKFLTRDDYGKKVDRVIFCVFLETDQNYYEDILAQYISQM